MGLIAEGVGHNGYGDGKGRWVGGVLESVQLIVAGEDFSHVLEGREERGLTQAARSFWERLISRGEPGAR